MRKVEKESGIRFVLICGRIVLLGVVLFLTLIIGVYGFTQLDAVGLLIALIFVVFSMILRLRCDECDTPWYQTIGAKSVSFSKEPARFLLVILFHDPIANCGKCGVSRRRMPF